MRTASPGPWTFLLSASFASPIHPFLFLLPARNGLFISRFIFSHSSSFGPRSVLSGELCHDLRLYLSRLHVGLIRTAFLFAKVPRTPANHAGTTSFPTWTVTRLGPSLLSRRGGVTSSLHPVQAPSYCVLVDPDTRTRNPLDLTFCPIRKRLRCSEGFVSLVPSQ